ALSELKARGATIVMVGHRPSTLSEATKVLLLQEGRVTLFGPRDEVLSRLRKVSTEQIQKRAVPKRGDGLNSPRSAAST
ncbi:MAG: hypothetical protein ACR2PG_00400, partial [Hyphomicrobiaceae bacterium]